MKIYSACRPVNRRGPIFAIKFREGGLLSVTNDRALIAVNATTLIFPIQSLWP